MKTLTLTILLASSAFGYESHRPSYESIKQWGDAGYGDERQEIERQWDYERRVIDLENQREQQQWEDRRRKTEEYLDRIERGDY